jgi:hypothetical protein
LADLAAIVRLAFHAEAGPFAAALEEMREDVGEESPERVASAADLAAMETGYGSAKPTEEN